MKNKPSGKRITLALPKAIVVALYSTWKAARKNINICN
jgi:hypothetical protein